MVMQEVYPDNETFGQKNDRQVASRAQAIQFVSQTIQNPRFGFVDRPVRDAHFLGDVSGGASVDSGLPKHLPGSGVE
jgi:hypothetical protein